MATTLATRLTASLTATLANALDLSTPYDPLSLSLAIASFTSGTAINQADKSFHDRRTLTTASSENIDLYDFAGALDPLGVALALVRVKILIIVNRSVVVGDILTIGGEGSGATWNSPFNADDDAKLTIAAGGTLILCAPSAAAYAVADSTNHLLKIENPGGNTVSYDLVVIGASA